MILRELKKVMKEEFTPSEMRDVWKEVVSAARDDKHTVRTVKYQTTDVVGTRIQYSLLDEAIKHLGRIALEHYGDWATYIRLEIIPHRDFTPSAMKMNIEDVIDIHSGPGCLRRLLPSELRNKYFEEVVETTTKWKRKKVTQ